MTKPTKGIATDVGTEGNPGKCEYRGVDIETGKVLFHVHIPGISTNNIGEFLGAVHGLRLALGTDKKVYSDSITAISWVRRRACKSKFQVTDRRQVQMIVEALAFLFDNSSVVYKWDTAKWGEVPADFNRKSGSKGRRI